MREKRKSAKDMIQEYVTEKEAAKILGVSPNFIRKERREKRLTYHTFGRTVRIKVQDLEMYAEQRKVS